MVEAVILTKGQRRSLTQWVPASLPDTRERDDRFGGLIMEYAGISIEVGEVAAPARLIDVGVPASVFEGSV